ncbi:diaminopimelate epimerase [Alteribacillus sp. HJP-4]|uniref:diaminopimelate epimerase n=1 Tax=Alteribacillus sp. HJP-4 TaxID=2775394 RepID=UPI0035CD32B7
MHGLGNSYIYVNEFTEDLRESELAEHAVKVSNKNTGIGSDGMILIGPSETSDIRMRVFNSDGSEAKNCGNGLRCVAKYAYENKLVDKPVFTVETLSGPVKAEVHTTKAGSFVDQVTIDMGKPRLFKKDIPMAGEPESKTINEAVTAAGLTMKMTAVSMGNPHAVFFVEDIEAAPVKEAGPVLEKHSMFPEWANIEFVEVISETEMNFRVWERGSGITKACGTGACAAVVAAVLTGRAGRGIPIIVHLLGGDLQITWNEDGRVWMTGPAEVICEGSFY